MITIRLLTGLLSAFDKIVRYWPLIVLLEWTRVKNGLQTSDPPAKMRLRAACERRRETPGLRAYGCGRDEARTHIAVGRANPPISARPTLRNARPTGIWVQAERDELPGTSARRARLSVIPSEARDPREADIRVNRFAGILRRFAPQNDRAVAS